MKFTIVVLSVFCFALVASIGNIDEVIKDKNRADALINCILKKGPCSEEAAKWRDSVREVINTHCGKCSDKEKGDVVKFIKYLVDKRQKEWNEIVALYNITPEEKAHLEDIAENGPHN